MQKIPIGQLLQLLGNAGVIVGIVLLVFELNQNQRMMQAQTRAALSQETADDLFRFSETEGLAELWFRGAQGGELTDLEQLRFNQFVISRMRRQENVQYQFRMGLYDESEYEAQTNGWRRLYAMPGVAAVFCERRSNFSPQYVAEIEDLMEASCE
jgi:hypothetical protein